MTIDAGLKPEGAPERSPIAGAGAPSGVDAGPRRYSVQRKMAVVARLLRGEPLDVVAREANVSVAKLTECGPERSPAVTSSPVKASAVKVEPWTPFCLSSGDLRGVDLPASLSDEGEDLSSQVTLQGSNGVEL